MEDIEEFFSHIFEAIGDTILELGDHVGALFGMNLSGAQREQNEFNRQQADVAYNRQLYMDNTKMQRAVQDYQAAGLNPYSLAGGTMASPSAPQASSGGLASPSLSDVLTLVTLPMQLKALKAQIKNTEADTEKKGAEKSKTEAETSETQERERGARIVNDFNENTANIRGILLEDSHVMNEFKRFIDSREIAVKEAAQSVLEENSLHYNAMLDAQKDFINEQKTSESFKRAEMAANAREANANANYKNAMLALDKKIAEATEEKVREELELLKLEAKLKRGIYNEQYIKDLCSQAHSEAEMARVLEAYNRGDYSAASKSLRKMFLKLEKEGTKSTFSVGSQYFSYSNNAAAPASALPVQ